MLKAVAASGAEILLDGCESCADKAGTISSSVPNIAVFMTTTSDYWCAVDPSAGGASGVIVSVASASAGGTGSGRSNATAST